jgi:DNA-binding transcriptional LysR family regulator
MTQPTVSNYIKSLENSIGVKLLNRDSHSVSLTTEGQEFVGYASQMLTIQMERRTGFAISPRGARLYPHAMLSSTAELFSECLYEFSRAQPGVQVDVSIKEGTEMMRAISQNAYDIYFANKYMNTG